MPETDVAQTDDRNAFASAIHNYDQLVRNEQEARARILQLQHELRTAIAEAGVMQSAMSRMETEIIEMRERHAKEMYALQSRTDTEVEYLRHARDECIDSESQLRAFLQIIRTQFDHFEIRPIARRPKPEPARPSPEVEERTAEVARKFSPGLNYEDNQG